MVIAPWFLLQLAVLGCVYSLQYHVRTNEKLGLDQQKQEPGSQELMLEITIDKLLRDDDVDDDGYIDYIEYRISNRRYHKK
ncbi:hypothetical protein ElyMa_003355300 [Elysia marginata]|uniref:EF-hand domain-containing protein n=1 Tax=Elysia marginata TaxID=1093978 RepID=A0AAV4JK53_9GAST|nr:hypothetical protein ElyMa_003355300 [Elysia marginata]